MPLDVNTFAAKIKAKYPEYKDMDNTLLAQKIVEKYPEYKDQVSFEPLKKKEPTTLPSKPSQESGMSVSKTAVKPKPSVSSTSKTEGDLYSGYPSNKGKVYKLDTSTGVPVWHEYSSTVAATKPGEVNKDLYEKPITDASRVNELNKFFKQNASTREGEQVFTGYPGKEKNQYRINNGAWERKVPGQKDWTELNNEASIKSLNAKFGGDVQFKALKAKYSGAVVDTFKAEKEAMDKNLLSVNGNLIGKSEAEVVSSLQSKFPGFEFKKDGLLTDQMIVIAPNKQVLKVSLDNITSGDDSARAVELRNWIKVNSSKELAKVTNELDVLQNVRQGMRYAVPGDKEYVADSPYGQVQIPITNETALEQLGVVNRVKAEEIKQKTSELAKVQARTFNNIIDESISSNLSQSELNARLAAIPHDKITAKRVNQYSNDVLAISKSKDLKTKELNDFSEEVLSKLKSGEITQEQYDAEYKPQLESKIEAINSQSELLKGELSTVSSVNKSLNESIAKNYLIQQSKGTVVGGVISKALTGATYLPRLMSGGGISAQDQKDLVNLITGGSTTEEYMSSEDRGDITKVLFSMAESVGAMATGGLAGGVEGAVAKFAVGSIPFYGQSYYNMKDEFDSIPDVVDKNGNSHSAMSETEKVLMSGLYAIGSAILEKFGLDFALGKTPFGKDLTNSIMKSAFSSIPKNATKEMIEIAIESSAKKLLAQAGVKTLGAMATEGSTEILQAGLEATIKESYDAIKETGYFNNKPDEDGNPTNKTAWDITKGMLYEGYLGALGGGLMSTVAQSKSAITNGLNKALNEEQIQALINTANIDGINDSVLAGLKNNILSGKIDKVEAKEILESFEKVQSHVRSMPENLTDLQKAASLNLLLEKSNKEKQIEGKDKSLVNKQIERVNAINEELKNISNATTESKQENIPVESSTTEYKGISEGQQKVGETERIERNTTTNEANISDSNQPVQEKEVILETKNKAGETTGFISEYTQKDGSVIDIDGSTLEEVQGKIDEIKSIEQQPAFEEVKDLDTNDKTHLERVHSFLDNISKNLDEVLDPKNLNDATRVIPAIVLKPIVEVLKVAVSAGMSLEQAIKKYVSTQEKYTDQEQYTEKEIHDTLNLVHEVKQKVAKENVIGAEKIQKQKVAEAKSITKKPVSKIEVNEASALKDQIKLEARAAKAGYVAGKNEIKAKMKEAIAEVKTKHKAKNTLIKEGKTEIKARIKEILKVGKVPSSKVTSIMNKLNSLKTDNPVMVDRFMNYVEKVFEKAEYDVELSAAMKIQTAIKKVAKSSSVVENVTAVAKQFRKINVSSVSDLDTYMEQAGKLKAAGVRSGGSTTATDLSIISEYVKKELDRQDSINKNLLSDINETIDTANDNELNPDNKKEIASEKLAEANAYLDSKYEEYSDEINEMISDKDANYTKKQKIVIDKLLKIDLKSLTLEQKTKIVEMMDNFIENESIASAEAFTMYMEGFGGRKILESIKSIVYKPLSFLYSKAVGRAITGSIASLDLTLEQAFGGTTSAILLKRIIGISDFSKGATTAEYLHDEAINEYVDIFGKKKPNGLEFQAVENVYERGLVAFLKRTSNGTEEQKQKEFNDKKNILNESIAYLKEGYEREQKMAIEYEKALNKLGINEEGSTIESIESKVDPINLEAVKWWTDKWKSIRNELEEVSSSVYNTTMEKDLFYIPIKISKIGKGRTVYDEKALLEQSSFQMALGIDKSKSGVLMESVRPGSLDERYVNLDFDINNSGSYASALLDVNTAGATQKISGFLASKYLEDTVSEDDKVLIRQRITNYQRLTKLKAMNEDQSAESLSRALNVIASVGASKTLGSIGNSVKQTIPVFSSTLVNSGSTGIAELMQEGANDFINTSGMGIAIRGMESSTTIDSVNSRIDRADASNLKNILKALEFTNGLWLKTFLVKPDVFAARAAFLAYYNKSLRSQGINTLEINWIEESKNKNEVALEYAQHMVDRQQSISEVKKAGNLFTSSDPLTKIFTKTVLPFASFILNQKQRMHSDMRVLSIRDRKLRSTEAKKAAGRSLAGTTLEVALFNVIAYGLKEVITHITDSIVGYDDPEDEDKKRKKIAQQNAVGNMVKDFLSPIPATDYVVINSFNALAEMVQSRTIDPKLVSDAIKAENDKRGEVMTEKQEIKFKEKFIKDTILKFEEYSEKKDFNLGTVSIMYDKSKEQYDMTKATVTGEITTTYKGNTTTKQMLPSDIELLKKASALNSIYLILGLPAEVNQGVKRVIKIIKNRSLSEDQYEKYEKIKKKGKELSKVEEYIIRSSSTLESALGDIRYAERHPELTDDEIIEKLEKY
jgi:hypothetical protein